MKEEKRKEKQRVLQFRRDMKDYFAEIGLGVGAIVQERVYERDTYSKKEKVLLVSKIVWDEFSPNHPAAIKCLDMENLSAEYRLDFGKHKEWNVYGSRSFCVKVAVPATEVKRQFDEAYGSWTMRR